MRSLFLLISLFACSISLADDSTLVPIRVHVQMLGLSDSAELPNDRDLTADDIQRLIKGDHLQWSRRFELATLNESEARLQIGESHNVVRSTQSVGGRSPSTGDAARDAAIRQALMQRSQSRSSAEVQTGTLVQVTPRILDDGRIAIEISADCSHMAPPPADESEFRAGPQTLTVQSTVLVSEDNPAIFRATVRSNDDTNGGHALIVIGAHVLRDSDN